MFVRNCPNCNVLMEYKRKEELTRSIKNNWKCRKCRYILNNISECQNPNNNPNCKKTTTSKICRSCASFGKKNGNYGSSYYDVWIKKYGKDRADKMNVKVSIKKARYGVDNGMFGKCHSEKTKQKIINNRKWDSDTKKKQRISAIKRIKRQKYNTYDRLIPSYNPTACTIIEEYGKEHGYSFQHAENGGEFHIRELGYFVDGYDREQNVVIEYYEFHHKNQTDRDKQRKREIIEFLGCEFIELKEWELNQ